MQITRTKLAQKQGYEFAFLILSKVMNARWSRKIPHVQTTQDILKHYQLCVARR